MLTGLAESPAALLGGFSAVAVRTPHLALLDLVFYGLQAERFQGGYVPAFFTTYVIKVKYNEI